MLVVFSVPSILLRSRKIQWSLSSSSDFRQGICHLGHSRDEGRKRRRGSTIFRMRQTFLSEAPYSDLTVDLEHKLLAENTS